MPDATFTVDYSWPAKQFIPGGSANRYIDSRLVQAAELARGFAPARSGELKASIRKTGTLNRGLLGAVGSLYASAPHAAYVHGGTPPVIKAKNKRGRGMPIPVASKGLPYRIVGKVPGAFVWRRQVRGQRPQPFLAQAVAVAFRDLL